MERRQFVHLSGIAAGALVMPMWGRPFVPSGSITPIPTADKKDLADTALNAAAPTTNIERRRLCMEARSE